jgi:hypothetical protein
MEERQHDTPTELCHMMRKHDCDKGLGFHNYSTLYYRLFAPVRDEKIDFLEIGHNKGGVSLPVWSSFFTNARVLGADIIQTAHRFSQQSPEDIHRLFGEIGEMDVVIDDGIHNFKENWNLFIHAIGHVKPGGIYIIEDLKKETMEEFNKRRDSIMSRYHLDAFEMVCIPFERNQYDNRMLVMRKKKVPDLTIVTAASSNHSKSLIQFLSSVKIHKADYKNLIVYDLGLDPMILHILKDLIAGVQIRTFDYDKYPDFFDIRKNAGEYAWKPVIIEEVAMEARSGVLLWCDAGNKVIDDLTPLRRFMTDTCIYTPESIGTIAQWTHYKTRSFFDIDPSDAIEHMIMRNAAVCAFRLVPEMMDFIHEWARCARIRECIAPRGSDRSNHRQDQSVLSILFYRFVEKYPRLVREVKNTLMLQIHQDIDN